MLWSGCTSTFMPFFSVRVVTGNSCDCARTSDEVRPQAHNSSNAILPYLIVFMSPPLPELFI
jgi:hypothetical protein